MLNITDIFNTREIAIGIIVFFLIFFVIYKDKDKEVLNSLKGVINSFLSPKIITPILFMFLYSVGMVYLLYKIGLWENHQIKNIIYWLFAVGILTHFKKDEYSAKAVIKDTISLLAIFQFILTFYTFNLFFELLFIILTVIFTSIKLVSEKDEKNKAVAKFASVMLSIFGFILVYLSINQYITNFNEFANSKTFYDFFVPTFLSIMIIPYFYIFFMLVKYETSLVSLSFAIRDDEKLRRYAKLRAMLAFNFNSKNFERWCNNLISYELDKNSIKESIKDIKKLNKVRRNIHKIDIKKGWHPFIANEFLKDYDVMINEYRRSFGGIWSGYSNYIRIHEEKSDIHYKIEGGLDYVNKLQVQLFFYYREDTNVEKTYNTFVNMCNDLSINALKYPLPKQVLNALITEDDIKIGFYGKRIRVEHEIFETGAYKLIFTIY